MQSVIYDVHDNHPLKGEPFLVAMQGLDDIAGLNTTYESYISMIGGRRSLSYAESQYWISILHIRVVE